MEGPSYEDRIVLYLDFLGFSEIVSKSTQDEIVLHQLLDALQNLRELNNTESPTKVVTHFSDSLVVSYKVSDESSAFWMLNEIAWSVISLAGRGYLLRGGVSVGKLFHNNEYVVGPALVRAYKIESQIAVYPRVVVDENILAAARSAPSDIHSPDDEEQYVKKFLTEDSDGHFFVDYITFDGVVDRAGADFDGYPDYLASLGEIVRIGLQKADIRTLPKYIWLHEKYVNAIDIVKNSGANFIESEPELYYTVADLPTLQKELDAAQERIKHE